METKNGAPTQGSPDLKKLRAETKAAERAVFLARTDGQRETFRQKAVAIWQKGLATVSEETLFSGKKDAFLKDKLTNGKNDTEKTQAALWILDKNYGTMLGSFGTAGIDGKSGAFTTAAVAQFKQDLIDGKYRDVYQPDPSATISDKEAMQWAQQIAARRLKAKETPAETPKEAPSDKPQKPAEKKPEAPAPKPAISESFDHQREPNHMAAMA